MTTRCPTPHDHVYLPPEISSEEERQLLARQRYLQEKKRMIILDESRAEEQARKEAGLARIEQVIPTYCNIFWVRSDAARCSEKHRRATEVIR